MNPNQVFLGHVSEYMSDPKTPLKREFNRLEGQIRSIIISGSPIKPQFDKLIPDVFNFRQKVIKWAVENQKMSFDQIAREQNEFFENEKFKLHLGLEVLHENILFATRTIKRVVEGIKSQSPVEEINLPDHIPQITYDQFLTLLSTLPNERFAERTFVWTNSMMLIEMVVISEGVMMDDAKLEVSDHIINTLAFIVADSAQEYTAAAMELGMVMQRVRKEPFEFGPLDEEFVRDQQYLADIGLEDFAKAY